MRGVIPFNDEHFMLIGYSAKGGVNVELKVGNPQTTSACHFIGLAVCGSLFKVDFDKAGHGSIPARESAITILTKGFFQLTTFKDIARIP